MNASGDNYALWLLLSSLVNDGLLIDDDNKSWVGYDVWIYSEAIANRPQTKGQSPAA